MSKTFIYSIAIILLFFLVIRPLNAKENSSESTIEKSDNAFDDANEDGIKKGASGQMQYRIGGYTK